MTLLRPRGQQNWLGGGTVVAADRAYLYKPMATTGPRGGSIPCAIYCHGSGETVSCAIDPGPSFIVQHLTNMGFAVLVADLGDPTVSSGVTSGTNSWGNSTVTTRIEAYRTYLAGLSGLYASKIVLLGASMGSTNSLAYYRDYPSKVSAIVNLIPFCDPGWARTNRANGSWPGNVLIAPLIDAAWGMASGDANSTQPNMDLANLAGIVGAPWRAYYHADDATAPASQVTAMATHLGASATAISLGNGIRTVTDGVTNSTNTITSATAAFTVRDVGFPVASTDIPGANGSLITSVNSATSATLAASATASHTGQTFTIGTGHTSAAWQKVDIDALLSWLTPLALN